MEEWVLKEKGFDFEDYEISRNFNGDIYTVLITVVYSYKSEKFWVAMSSGKKKAHREIFEDKEYKSKGGLEALLWAKKSY